MTNMNEMMEQMMEKMMENMMSKLMEKMVTAMSEPVKPEPEQVIEKKQEAVKLTKSALFDLVNTHATAGAIGHLDFEPVDLKHCKYVIRDDNDNVIESNPYIPSDVWTINHIAITQNYKSCKYCGKRGKFSGCYAFNTTADLANFLQTYAPKTELTDVDRHNVKVYKQDKAKAQAEYWAKKARGEQ